MSSVGMWVLRFLSRHKKRYRPHDWPTVEDAEEFREFVQMWVDAFSKKRVTEGEADKASLALGSTPPNWRREHLEMVMAKIQQQRVESGSSEGEEQKFAREASGKCIHCGGNGLTLAWAAQPSRAARIPESVPAHCVCPLGRWQRSSYIDRFPNGFSGILDFQHVLDGKAAGWLAEPPGRLDPPAVVPAGRIQWRDYVRLFPVPSS